MASGLRHITVAPESELAHGIKAANESGEPLTVDIGEASYTVFVANRSSRTADEASLPSPAEVERSRHGIHEAAGSWKDAGVDAEAFKRYIKERRRTANRPSPQL